MKKTLALLMTLALVISALALPALAEETNVTTDQTTSASVQTGKGGRGGGRQMPQMPGQNDQNSQLPQQPGQNSQDSQMPGRGGKNRQMPGNGQMPQMPDQNNQQPGQDNQNSQQTLPRMDGRGMKHGGHGGRQQLFDQLLKDGIITQETYDTIAAYLQKNAPQQQDSTAAPADGAEPPAAPEGQTEAPEGQPESPEQQLLKDMLDKGIITQEQYDEYITKLTPDNPAGNT